MKRKAPATSKDWATYVRLRRSPTKKCVACGREHPNTGEFFALGHRNRVTNTCLDCRAKQILHAPEKGACPMCRDVKVLRQDLSVTKDLYPDGPVKLCAGCHLRAGQVANNLETYKVIVQYVEWRARLRQARP